MEQHFDRTRQILIEQEIMRIKCAFSSYLLTQRYISEIFEAVPRCQLLLASSIAQLIKTLQTENTK